MTDEKIVIIQIDAEHMPESLPKGFVAFYAPSVNRVVLVPENDVEEMREEFRDSENTIEKEAEPEDILQFQECIKDSIPHQVQKAIIYAPQPEDEMPDIRLEAVRITQPQRHYPRHVEMQNHFHSNKNFNTRQNTKIKSFGKRRPR